MKKLYLRVLMVVGAIALPTAVIWIVFFKVPKMISDNEDYKKCTAQCHPNLVEQYVPCVCDTRYKHGKDVGTHGS